MSDTMQLFLGLLLLVIVSALLAWAVRQHHANKSEPDRLAESQRQAAALAALEHRRAAELHLALAGAYEAQEKRLAGHHFRPEAMVPPVGGGIAP